MAADWKCELAEYIDDANEPRPAASLVAQTLAPGAVASAALDGYPVAVARLEDGQVVAIADACPHDGGPLSSGFLDGDRLVCPRHGWEIDLRTGECPNRKASPCPITLLWPAIGAVPPGPGQD